MIALLEVDVGNISVTHFISVFYEINIIRNTDCIQEVQCVKVVPRDII
jgi:hypothetical protein